MKLFNYFDSYLIDLFHDFFSEYDNEEDINTLFDEYFNGNGTTFYNSEDDVLDVFPMLKKENNELLPLFDVEQKVLLNTVELESVQNALASEYSSYFIDEQNKAEIKAIFNDISSSWNSQAILERHKHNYKIDTHVCENLQFILHAILNKESIVVTNHTKIKIYENQELIPLRIESTSNKNLWTVTAYLKKEDRFINLNISRLSGLKKGSRIEDVLIVEQKYKEFLQKQKKQTVVLELSANNYDIDRFVRVFSYYEKQIEYNKKTNIYTITLQYYSFDEDELIINILNFGKLISIKSPTALQQKINNQLIDNN